MDFEKLLTGSTLTQHEKNWLEAHLGLNSRESNFEHCYLTHEKALCLTPPTLDWIKKILDLLKTYPIHDICMQHEQNTDKLILEALFNPSDSFDPKSGLSERFLKQIKPFEKKIIEDLSQKISEKQLSDYYLKIQDDGSALLVLVEQQIPDESFLVELIELIHRYPLELESLSATQCYLQQEEFAAVIRLKCPPKQAYIYDDFILQLSFLKWLNQHDEIKTTYIESNILTHSQSNLVRAMISWIHQLLVHEDMYAYSYEEIAHTFCNHPDLVVSFTRAFDEKFNPLKTNLESFNLRVHELEKAIHSLDSGNPLQDLQSKHVFLCALQFIQYCLKSNFYRPTKRGLSFRIDPKILTLLPYDYSQKFPQIPFAIFFLIVSDGFGFHIRFKDLSRGGFRTVLPQKKSQFKISTTQTFAECYNLAYTQHKKNKDIPEGGSKAVLILKPFEISERLKNTLQAFTKDPTDRKNLVEQLQSKRLYRCQKAFIDSLLVLINSDEQGRLLPRNIVDYYQKPEYLYLGPDENLHNSMIDWIASYSVLHHYRPQSAFMSSKPDFGINHKAYGVTSHGVHVYLKHALKTLNIDPYQNTFTVKMSGGPDGDVAGNQILNLAKDFSKTAKLITLIDGSGCIYDPQGLNWDQLVFLFHQGLPIANYSPDLLNPQGWLLDTTSVKEENNFQSKTLLWQKTESALIKNWVTGQEKAHLLKTTVHQTSTDIFIPGGGRPKTLDISNIDDFFDQDKKPTAKAIIEGANLYLSNEARSLLEKHDVLIFKDSSANKGGVTCSSFEVLCSLVLSPEEFMKHKKIIVAQILDRIAFNAQQEAATLLINRLHFHENLTDLSDELSSKINTYKDQIQDYLESNPNIFEDRAIWNEILLNYALPILKNQFRDKFLKLLPLSHKIAIIACHLASNIVYLNEKIDLTSDDWVSVFLQKIQVQHETCA